MHPSVLWLHPHVCGQQDLSVCWVVDRVDSLDILQQASRSVSLQSSDSPTAYKIPFRIADTVSFRPIATF
jgi:hypothetical protein